MATGRGLRIATAVFLVVVTGCATPTEEKGKGRSGLSHEDLPYVVLAPSDVSRFGPPRSAEGLGWPQGTLTAVQFATQIGGSGETVRAFEEWGFLQAHAGNYTAIGPKLLSDGFPDLVALSAIAIFQGAKVPIVLSRKLPVCCSPVPEILPTRGRDGKRIHEIWEKSLSALSSSATRSTAAFTNMFGARETRYSPCALLPLSPSSKLRMHFK